MKRWLTVLAVLLLLLPGCGEYRQEETNLPSTTAAPVATEPETSLLDLSHILTRQTGGAVAAYPLEDKVCAMEFMGQKILLASACTEGLKLTLLAGEEGLREAQTTLAGLDSTNPLWVGADKVICLDHFTNRLVFLDSHLKEVNRLPMPQVEITSMVMDARLSTLYYSTEDKLCALDLTTGISRLLRQSPDHDFTIISLEKDLLQCWTRGQDGVQKELISCQDGRVQYSGDKLVSIYAAEASWMAVYTDGPVTQWLYGQKDHLQIFSPVMEGTVLPQKNGNVLVACQPKDVAQVLDYYDMQAGTRSGSVTLKNIQGTAFHKTDDAGVWFVATEETGGDVLCYWNPEKSPAEAVACLSTRYTRENPDRDAIARCNEYAQQIGQQYGITVSLDLPEALQEDYRIQTEYHADAIYAALEAVEYGLSQFPERFYERVVRVTNTRSFHISLVRSITGAGGEAVSDERGLQAWSKGDAYIVLAVGDDVLEQFYHQMWHMTETYVLTRNSVLDTWDWMNPEGFAYLETYQTDGAQIPEQWLSGETRAFTDHSAITYPREDRAQFFVYAMTPGNEAVFESEIMQEKLNSLCWSVRRAFKWETETGTVFPWEQYLDEFPYGSMI